MDWRHRAACRDEDGELFFPVGVSGPALLQIAEAKTVCRRCPTVSACLAYALDNNIEFGIYGAMTEQERAALKRRNARTRARVNPPATREPLAVDGQVMAAPLVSETAILWNNKRRTRHAYDVRGKALCVDASVNLRNAEPAASVADGDLCGRQACRKAFATTVTQPPLLLAIASEGAIGDKTGRWHATVDGAVACQAVLMRPMTKPARDIDTGRRCRQRACRALWEQLDTELEASRG